MASNENISMSSTDDESTESESLNDNNNTKVCSYKSREEIDKALVK